MLSKRIATALVGTALAASAVIVPQVSATQTEDSVAVAGSGPKHKCRDHHHKPKQCPTPVTPTETVTATTTTTAPAPTETETTSVTATETATTTKTTSITNTKTETATETVGSSFPEGSSEDVDASPALGSAAFGLSAIAGGALLLQHFFKPAPAPEGPATGPVAVEDAKAAAQQ